jgi:hypothetical protein
MPRRLFGLTHTLNLRLLLYADPGDPSYLGNLSAVIGILSHMVKLEEPNHAVALGRQALKTVGL